MYKHILGLRKLLVFIFLIITILIFMNYQTYSNIEFGVLSSMITFIYGFHINSIFKFVEAKYLSFKKQMASISANSQSLYNIAILTKNIKYKDSLQKEIIEFIDSFKKYKPTKYENNQYHIDKIFQTISLYKIKTNEDKNLHNKIISIMINISNSREELELFGDKYLVGEMKFIYLIFTLFISMMIIIISFQSIITIIFATLLIFMLIFMTYLIFDLDNLDYGKYSISIGNFEQLKKFIKKN